MKRIRLLTFNIHGGRSLDGKRDLRRVHALMERLEIDIGIFQEMETRESQGCAPTDVGVLSGLLRPYYLPGPSITEKNGWYGNLIVSRYPILRGLVHNLETKPDLEPRNAVDALIQTPLGNIRVIGTHLSLSYLERRSEARNLIRLMHDVEEEEKNPLFLMGDINEWQRPSKLLNYMGSIMQPVKCMATFPSYLPVFRLDRAWYDAPGLLITGHRIFNRETMLLSDHLPVLIEVMKSC